MNSIYSLFDTIVFSKKLSNSVIIVLAAATFLYTCAEARTAPAASMEKDMQQLPGTEITGWQIKDYGPYIQAVKDITKLSRSYSENMLKLAMDEYSAGIGILEKMEADIAKLEESNKNKANPGEMRWQEIDRKDREKRQIYGIKQEAKMKSVTYFFLSISHIDEIRSESVPESKEMADFKARLYQIFVATQYDLRNFPSCIPVLEKYILLNKDTKNDLWAHKYLANCYAYMENLSQKSGSIPKEDGDRYGKLKNKHLLKAAEIQYGINSPEYKNTHDIVKKYERKNMKDKSRIPGKQ